MLLSEICGLVSMGRPLWREDGSAICSVITQWSESLRTRNHTLLSHLRPPQPGGPGSRIYIPQEQSGPVIPPGTRFPFHPLLRLAGLQWRYSNPPPTWRDMSRIALLMSWGGPNIEPRSDHYKTPFPVARCLLNRIIATNTCSLVLLRIGYRCS
jgi:hypothetical protein